MHGDRSSTFLIVVITLCDIVETSSGEIIMSPRTTCHSTHDLAPRVPCLDYPATNRDSLSVARATNRPSFETLIAVVSSAAVIVLALMSGSAQAQHGANGTPQQPQMDRTACLGPIPRTPFDPTAEMADMGGAAATEGTVELVRMRLHRPVGMNPEGVGMVVTVARAADSEDKAVMEAAGPATRKVPTSMVPMVGTVDVVIPAVEMAAQEVEMVVTEAWAVRVAAAHVQLLITLLVQMAATVGSAELAEMQQ